MRDSASSDLAAVLGQIDAYDGIGWDEALLDQLAGNARGAWTRPLMAALPGFKSYASDELESCARSGAFPAFSITGSACALQCGHCRGRILQPMLPTISPEALEREVHVIARRQGIRGFLLSGGSDRRNEVRFERWLPAVKRLKSEMPDLEVAVHTGLVDRRRAGLLADAGVGTAMLDIIGAEETVREVYNLSRPVADFEASLAHLVAAGLDVVPHVVIGLHFGRVLGEHAALDIIARHRTRAAIMVVLMTHLADARFVLPTPALVGRVLFEARARLADRTLLLGCARSPGLARREIDAYAVLAGLDGIAHPAEGAVTLARAVGRQISQSASCCGVGPCSKAA